MPTHSLGRIERPDGEIIRASIAFLGCCIDCDGGGLRARPAAQQRALHMAFGRLGPQEKGGMRPRTYRLRPANSSPTWRIRPPLEDFLLGKPLMHKGLGRGKPPDRTVVQT